MYARKKACYTGVFPIKRKMGYLWIILVHLFMKEILATVELNNKCVHIDYRGKNFSHEDTTCPNNEVCRKTFRISYVLMPPYSEYPLETVLRKCCGTCTKVKTLHTFANLTEVTPSSMNDSDFIGLFLGSSTAETLYGYYFIPVVYAPNVFYITSKGEPIILRIIKSCLLLYPLIIICMLMALISGFVAWILETRFNKVEFPRPFLIGWFEGFWWSFISMTTVGYGDKTPKSTAARLFSFVWILIGVAMFSIFTAMLTTEIMKAKFPDVHDISGSNVGILKYREYDASFIARHGGFVTETNGSDFRSDIFQLIRKLRMNETNGMLLDKYTLILVDVLLTEISQHTEYDDLKEDFDFFLRNTIRTEKVYGGEMLSFGILAKFHTDYVYFRDAIRDNRLPMETMISLQMNEVQHGTSVKKILFSPADTYFQESIKVMVGVLGAMVLFGVFYELRRRKIGCKRNASPQEVKILNEL